MQSGALAGMQGEVSQFPVSGWMQGQEAGLQDVAAMPGLQAGIYHLYGLLSLLYYLILLSKTKM